MNNNNRIQLPPPFQLGTEALPQQQIPIQQLPPHLQQQQQQQPSQSQNQLHHVQYPVNPSLLPNVAETTKFTKAGKNRMRVRKACDRCKRQKSKCDGSFPCSTCSIHNHKCEYSQFKQDNVPSSTGSSSTKINTPVREERSNEPKGYVRYLESRIRELETYIQNNNINSDDAKETFQKNMYTFSKHKYRVMRRYQNILPHELGSSVLNSLDDSEAEGLLVPRIQFYGWNMSGGHFLHQRQLPEPDNLVDYDKDLKFITWAVDFFMLKINPLFAIIHEKVFRDQLSSFLLHAKDEDTSKSTRLFTALLYLIISITLRYSEHDPATPDFVKKRNTSRLEEKLFSSAYEVVDRLSFEWQSSELIQAWILITFFLRTTYRQNASYMSLGSAVRMCKGMSLHLNIVPDALDKPYEWTKTRRVFWLVYTWDRLHGFQSGKGYDIQDRIIITPFPDLSDEIEDGWLTKPALAMLHLSRISGEMQNFVNSNYRRDAQFITKMTTQLNDWEVWFQSNSKGFDQLLIDQVFLTYYDIVLNFNNKVLFKLLEKEYYSDDSHKELSILVNSSKKVLKIFEEIDEQGLLYVPWYLNLSILFHVALINVFLLNAGIFQNPAMVNLKQSIEFLKKSQKHAHMAEECVWALKTLNHMCVNRMQKAIDSLTDIGTDQGPGTVNKVKFLQFENADDQNSNTSNKKRKISASSSAIMDQILTGSNSNYQAPPENLFQNDSNPEVFDLNNVDGLLSNLKWFEHWVDEFDHDTDS